MDENSEPKEKNTLGIEHDDDESSVSSEIEGDIPYDNDDDEPDDIDDASDDSDNEDDPEQTDVVVQQDNVITDNIPLNQNNLSLASDDDNSDDEEDYLQKFDDEIKKSYVDTTHPEETSANYEEIKALSKVIRNKEGIIIDELHKSIPILTKYELTNVLGTRAKQINAGAQSYIDQKDIIDGYILAQIELKQKKLPFIIKRPMPNGGCEYWKVSDLEILSY